MAQVNRRIGGSSQKHTEIFDLFKQGELSYPDAKGQLIKLWQATGKANKRYMEKMFRSWKLKKDAREIVEYLRNSYILCLISGAVDLYVETIANKLSIGNWYANTQLIFDSSGKLTDFNYVADQATKKLEDFHKFAKEKELSKDECAIVGDGDSDAVLFKELKYGIEVNKKPHPKLKGLAFRTINNLDSLKKYF